MDCSSPNDSNSLDRRLKKQDGKSDAVDAMHAMAAAEQRISSARNDT